MIRTVLKFPATALMLMALVVSAGCESPPMPWSDNGESYSSAETARANGPTGVIVGRFANPPMTPAGWESTGRVVAEQLRIKLAERADVSVRLNETLAADVERALTESFDRRVDSLRQIHQRDPSVRYVIVGKVTDFKHAAAAPDGTAVNGMPRQRAQAIAAITYEVVDLHQRRVAVTEQLEARIWASDASIENAYRGVAVGSHRFEETPLGLAMRDVVNQSADRFNQFSPPQQSSPIRIVDRLTQRRVRLASDAPARAAVGSEWFVCEYDSSGTDLKPVNDPATGQPLKARIESRGLYPEAWLMGEPPTGFKLNRAVLCAMRPRAVHASAK